MVGLPNLLRVASDVSDDELGLARNIVVAMLRYLPVMVRLMGAMFDDPNFAGFSLVSKLDEKPELALLMLLLVVGMMRAGLGENLSTVASAVAPVPGIVSEAKAILDLPYKVLESNLADESPERRQGIMRIAGAAADGLFDIHGDNGAN